MTEMLQKVQKVFQNAVNFDQLFLRFKSDEVIAPSAAQAKIARKRLESTNKFLLLFRKFIMKMLFYLK